ncbi:hypothetical protein AOQ84DRAFT_386904 [Glonium stellatum]|uniref:Uncharacterized protein n=1 Tax=Glonium stellatum TaxID=574774 RepID=A0A8E2F6A9_9PEZI|nr:hypothetical protein AOQ84DRAFT_386904 [Glonium stellatum]
MATLFHRLRFFSSTRGGFFRGWFWEFCGVLLALSALTAIVITLIKFDGAVVPRMPLGFTLNTVVSALATVAKAALLMSVAAALSQFKWIWVQEQGVSRPLRDLQLFDDASRGPWGALMMLFNTRVFHVTSIGALITILALALDPSVQQLISTGQRSVYADSVEASLNRAENFTASSSGILEYPMREAILIGALSSTAIPEHMPSCPTGNCTWPIFDTLALCSKCNTLNPHTEVESRCNSSLAFDDAESNFILDHINATANPSFRSCNYTFPSSPFPEIVAYGVGQNETVPQATVYESYSTVYSTVWFSDGGYHTIVRNNTNFSISNPAFALGAVRIDPMTTLPIEAHECYMSFCVKTFAASTINGVLNTTTVNTVYFDGVPDLNRTGSEYMLSIPPAADGPATNYTVEYFTWEAVGMDLAPYFSGALGASLSSTGIVSGNWESSDVLSALNQTSNITFLMNNVAVAMTNYIRNTNSLFIYGQAGTMETFTHVTWYWLILPVFVILGAFIFLLVAILETSRNEAKLWKSSSLALLFHGLEHTTATSGLNELEEMEQEADNMRVRLRMTEKDRLMLFDEL